MNNGPRYLALGNFIRRIFINYCCNLRGSTGLFFFLVSPYLSACGNHRNIVPFPVFHPKHFTVSAIIGRILHGKHSGYSLQFFGKDTICIQGFFRIYLMANETKCFDTHLLHVYIHDTGKTPQQSLSVGAL